MTVLFKLLRGRTKNPVQRRRASRSSRAPLRNDFLPRIVASRRERTSRMRRREREFFEGAGYRNATPGNFRQNFANYLSARSDLVPLHAKSNAGAARDEGRRGGGEDSCRINDLANRARKSRNDVSVSFVYLAVSDIPFRRREF